MNDPLQLKQNFRHSTYQRRRLVLLIIGLVFLGCAIVFCASTVGAQTATPDFSCPGRAIVRVIPGAALNIRQTAQGAVVGNPIIGTLRFEDGDKTVIAESNGYLRLQAGGWIWNRYLTIICATPIPIATSTPTPVPQPTPTRIAENPRGGLWVGVGRGPKFWVDFEADCTKTPGRTWKCVLEIEVVP